MTDLSVERRPELHDPVVLAAFAGWNDAANAATDAAKFVIRRLGARRFASIDSENYYDFRETRPSVRIGFGGARMIEWPKNEFFFARNPIGPHDIIIATGVEPGLGWDTFAQMHVSLYRELGAGLVVTLGALLADVPHTRPTRVTGSAADNETSERLKLSTSRYEGPTGMVGILNDRLRTAGIQSASLWANVPHYITTSQNPMATGALLTRVQEIIGMTFDLDDMDDASERFQGEVNSALAGNPELQQYIKGLESAADTAGDEEIQPSQLPRGEELLLDIEDFLRKQRNDD